LKHGLRILVAVDPRELSRVIVHLLATYQEAAVICSIADPPGLLRYMQRVLPNIVIVNPPFVESALVQSTTIDALRNASPGVKLILTSRGVSPDMARRFPVDARLTDDALVDELIPTVHRLSLIPPGGSWPDPKGGLNDVFDDAEDSARRVSGDGYSGNERRADLCIPDRLRSLYPPELLHIPPAGRRRKLS
jgi:hypothetical protein